MLGLPDRVSSRPAWRSVEDELKMPDPDRGVVIARRTIRRDPRRGAGQDPQVADPIDRQIAARLGPIGVPSSFTSPDAGSTQASGHYSGIGQGEGEPIAVAV